MVNGVLLLESETKILTGAMLAVLIQSSCENDRKTVRGAGIGGRRKWTSRMP